jgi:uncharacterized membrane protein (UPF0127 family)|tara:strand:+ start:1434 stop:1910 length:477 start_codon:yes stop_codon:yes gene_type:complete
MDHQSINISSRIFILMLGFAGFSISAFSQGVVTFDKSKLSVITSTGQKNFEVEMAVSDQQQSQGLMYRRSMAANAGMLFDYGALRHIQMWMKNTYIPLDMIFIGPKGKIINIVERTIPHSESIISSKGRARAVLELNSGTVSRLGIKTGDTVIHSIFR